VDVSGTLTFLGPDDLPAMVELCKRAMPNDNITAEILLEKTFASSGAEGAFRCGYRNRDGELDGLIWAVPFESMAGQMGGIRVLAVRPERQRKGIGSLLLRPAEAYCWAHGAKEIWMMAMPGNYLTAGIDSSYIHSISFVQSARYERTGTAKDYSCDLTILEDPGSRLQAPVPDGFTIRRVNREERLMVLSVVRNFVRGAEEEIEHAFLRNPPGVFVCLCAGNIIAFLATEGNNPGTGSMGPLYVARECRRLGIGRALIVQGLKDLSARGYCYPLLPWTTPLLSDFLHRELKARQIRTRLIFKKKKQ
jgi:ribosomal protein S18 acetylase RimI-like enzyme